MAAAIDFFNGPGTTGLTTSGVGFYGATFGASVQVSSYQDTTFITNSNGTVNAGQLTNDKYPGNTSGIVINGGTEVQLSTVPVVSGTLNVRFTFDTVVKTQNEYFRIFDRVSANSPASGVTCQVAQLVNGGSGVNQTTGVAEASHNGWSALAGSGTVMHLLTSPGSGGLSPSGVDTTSVRHDWYVGISATPTSIGSKTSFGAYCELEYL